MESSSSDISQNMEDKTILQQSQVKGLRGHSNMMRTYLDVGYDNGNKVYYHRKNVKGWYAIEELINVFIHVS